MMLRLIRPALLTLALCLPAVAEAPAGMVMYTIQGGEVYLLLAEHAGSKRGWAGFGGGDEDGETPAQTAARKGHEESRGYFTQAEILAKTRALQPVMDGHFANYFVEIDFVPAQRLTNQAVPDSNDAYLERGTFAWIPYAAVEPHVQNDIDFDTKYPIDASWVPPGSETSWFWPIWLSNVRAAIVADSLPWDKP